MRGSELSSYGTVRPGRTAAIANDSEVVSIGANAADVVIDEAIARIKQILSE
jgi:hypothetical protein